MVKCEKCGSKVFLVDETVTHLEMNWEIFKQVSLTSACQMPNSYDKKNFASNRLVNPFCWRLMAMKIDDACALVHHFINAVTYFLMKR